MPRKLPPPTLTFERTAAGIVLRSVGPDTVEDRLAALRLAPGDLVYVVRAEDLAALAKSAATPLLAALVHGAN